MIAPPSRGVGVSVASTNAVQGTTSVNAAGVVVVGCPLFVGGSCGVHVLPAGPPSLVFEKIAGGTLASRLRISATFSVLPEQPGVKVWIVRTAYFTFTSVHVGRF